MPEMLTTGCLLKCSQGTAPMPFVALQLPGKPVIAGLPTAMETEIAPLVNIPSFVMCKSLGNPEVAAATSAADGELTPMPCVPVVTAPWMPASTIQSYNGVPLVTVQAKCLCDFGGEIAVSEPAAAAAFVSEAS